VAESLISGNGALAQTNIDEEDQKQSISNFIFNFTPRTFNRNYWILDVKGIGWMYGCMGWQECAETLRYIVPELITWSSKNTDFL
jgi:hypothetical protein